MRSPLRRNLENWHQLKSKPGQTKLYAGRLGIGAAYRAPVDAIEEEASEVGGNSFCKIFDTPQKEWKKSLI